MNTGTLRGILIFSLLLTSTAALAQGGPPAGQRDGDRRGQGGPPALPDSTEIIQMVDEMAVAVSLSADQKNQVSDLYFVHFAEVEEMMGKSGGDRENQRRMMDDLRQGFESDIEELLDGDQLAAFEEFAKNHRPPPGPQDRRR